MNLPTTALPHAIAGLNRHCLTAASAAASISGEMLVTTFTPVTVPSSPMTRLRVSLPSMPSAGAEAVSSMSGCCEMRTGLVGSSSHGASSPAALAASRSRCLRASVTAEATLVPAAAAAAAGLAAAA